MFQKVFIFLFKLYYIYKAAYLFFTATVASFAHLILQQKDKICSIALGRCTAVWKFITYEAWVWGYILFSNKQYICFGTCLSESQRHACAYLSLFDPAKSALFVSSRKNMSYYTYGLHLMICLFPPCIRIYIYIVQYVKGVLEF